MKKIFGKFFFGEDLLLAVIAMSIFSPNISQGSACCGGGFAIPSLITGDDKAQLTISYTYSKIDSDVFATGVWQKRSSGDISKILKIEGAHIFTDSFQAGFSLPIQTRNKAGVQGGESSGLGDLISQVGYEYLSDWDYNVWRPRGIGFISLTVPTGKSIYESDDGSGLDSRGRGFWALGGGTALTKSWVKWDANTSFEIHHSFEKPVHNSQINGTIKPGNGGSLSLGTGYNLQALRFGGAISWNYEDAIDVEGSNPSHGGIQRYAAGTLSTHCMLKDLWAATLSYSDQTLFGNPTNTSLGKTMILQLQRRWAR